MLRYSLKTIKNRQKHCFWSKEKCSASSGTYPHGYCGYSEPGLIPLPVGTRTLNPWGYSIPLLCTSWDQGSLQVTQSSFHVIASLGAYWDENGEDEYVGKLDEHKIAMCHLGVEPKLRVFFFPVQSYMYTLCMCQRHSSQPSFLLDVVLIGRHTYGVTEGSHCHICFLLGLAGLTWYRVNQFHSYDTGNTWCKYITAFCCTLSVMFASWHVQVEAPKPGLECVDGQPISLDTWDLELKHCCFCISVESIYYHAARGGRVGCAVQLKTSFEFRQGEKLGAHLYFCNQP
jgi:hypothetical protein